MEPVLIITTYGECRCCLTKGNHRDINKEYQYKGVREVFSDMITECFNLSISRNDNLTTLICSLCVSRLRDANNFRMMILNSEHELLEKFTNRHHTEQQESTVSTKLLDKCDNRNTSEIDEESSDIVLDPNWIKGDWDEDFTKTSEVDIESVMNVFKERFADYPPRPLPTRKSLYAICPKYVKYIEKFKDVPITSNAIKELLKGNTKVKSNTDEKKRKRKFITSRYGNISNIATLLEHSNIIPFKTRVRSGFHCFYCRSIFEDRSRLREHTLGHSKADIVSILRSYVPDRLVVNADVANLECTICNTTIMNIDYLKIHLKKVHGKTLYSEFNDRLVPFVLREINACVSCCCTFETFAALERHMNVHYRNYVCKECGMGFVTPNRLAVHLSNSHGRDLYPCKQCGKVFHGKAKHRTHVNVVHGKLKRFRCNKCPERFGEHHERQKHMTNEHGISPIVYKCNVCEKSFDRRYLLSRHLKKYHLEERDYQCVFCPYRCYSCSELKSHMIRHTGEKKFECSVCSKVFVRKKTLIEHMRIHNNDRRYACALCDQTFIQSSSLKCHTKNHHAG